MNEEKKQKLRAHKLIEWCKWWCFSYDIRPDIEEVKKILSSQGEFQELPKTLRECVLQDLEKWTERIQSAEMRRLYQDDRLAWSTLTAEYPPVASTLKEQKIEAIIHKTIMREIMTKRATSAPFEQRMEEIIRKPAFQKTAVSSSS